MDWKKEFDEKFIYNREHHNFVYKDFVDIKDFIQNTIIPMAEKAERERILKMADGYLPDIIEEQILGDK